MDYLIYVIENIFLRNLVILNLGNITYIHITYGMFRISFTQVIF